MPIECASEMQNYMQSRKYDRHLNTFAEMAAFLCDGSFAGTINKKQQQGPKSLLALLLLVDYQCQYLWLLSKTKLVESMPPYYHSSVLIRKRLLLNIIDCSNLVAFFLVTCCSIKNSVSLV